jgi:hypothetical protein
MRHDDTSVGADGARRIYRFHFGWSVCGRANHFSLADAAPHDRTGSHGAKSRDSGVRDAKAAGVSTSRSGAPETRPHTRERTTESES